VVAGVTHYAGGIPELPTCQLSSRKVGRWCRFAGRVAVVRAHSLPAWVVKGRPEWVWPVTEKGCLMRP